MVKLIVVFLLITTPAFSATLGSSKNEIEPLSFEKFLFKNSLKGPIVMNLKKIKKINKQVCEDSFSAWSKNESQCKFLFVAPDKIKIFKNEKDSQKIIVYYPEKDVLEY
jgi:hypothetical protein|tara:strand:+ start:1023 stop:1349 length:327 start_codon:yes stop_codon:yes gene_type:complete